MFRRIFSGLLCVLSAAIVCSALSGSQAEQKAPPLLSRRPTVRHIVLNDQQFKLEMAATRADRRPAGTSMAIAALMDMRPHSAALVTRP